MWDSDLEEPNWMQRGSASRCPGLEFGLALQERWAPCSYEPHANAATKALLQLGGVHVNGIGQTAGFGWTMMDLTHEGSILQVTHWTVRK